ncbi:MAG TPA: AAA family ATPase [Candidatus Angelobacter sp.]
MFNLAQTTNFLAYVLAAREIGVIEPEIHAAAVRCRRAIVENNMSVASACLQQAVSGAMDRIPRMALLTCGSAGSGKSTVAAFVAQYWGFDHLQTDLIRKRLTGLEPTARTGAAVNAGIYSTAMSDQLYRELGNRAYQVLQDGRSVVLDGSFLTRVRRRAAVEAVRSAGARVLILHCRLDRDEQVRRLRSRLADRDAISEGNVEVMVNHEKIWEPLLPGEADSILTVDTNAPSAEVESRLLPLLWRAALSA